jgi:hypothetical protein
VGPEGRLKRGSDTSRAKHYLPLTPCRNRGYIIAMSQPLIPSPKDICSIFHPYHAVLHRAAQKGSAEVRSFFKAKRQEIDRNLAPELFRYGAMRFLDGAGHKAVDEGSDYERDGQPKNGLLVHCGRLNVRMLKLPRDGDPPAPKSAQRQSFYGQGILPLETEPGQSWTSIGAWNLLLLWQVDRQYKLIDLHLVLPRGGDERQADWYWMERLEPPFSISATSAKPEPVEDLDMGRKKLEKTDDRPNSDK